MVRRINAPISQPRIDAFAARCGFNTPTSYTHLTARPMRRAFSCHLQVPLNTSPHPQTPVSAARDQCGHNYPSPENAHDAGTFTVHADGSCLGNPGPGGWAIVITRPDGSQTHCEGSLEATTNNRAELIAALQALLELPRDATGTIRMDSRYVVDGINLHRYEWERRGFKTAKGQGVANPDLWKALFPLADARPGISFRWTAGHAGDPGNELADTLARTEALKAKSGMMRQ
jgi:ribonuclease HI